MNKRQPPGQPPGQPRHVFDVPLAPEGFLLGLYLYSPDGSPQTRSPPWASNDVVLPVWARLPYLRPSPPPSLPPSRPLSLPLSPPLFVFLPLIIIVFRLFLLLYP